jgi:hypothetical protein
MRASLASSAGWNNRVPRITGKRLFHPKHAAGVDDAMIASLCAVGGFE